MRNAYDIAKEFVEEQACGEWDDSCIRKDASKLSDLIVKERAQAVECARASEATSITVANEMVVQAAQGIEADLSGNADSRIRGGYMLVEEVRVRHMLHTLRHLRRIRALASGETNQ